MKNPDYPQTMKIKTRDEWRDSLRIALEGDGLEDRSFELFCIFLAPGEKLVDFLHLPIKKSLIALSSKRWLINRLKDGVLKIDEILSTIELSQAIVARAKALLDELDQPQKSSEPFFSPDASKIDIDPNTIINKYGHPEISSYKDSNEKKIDPKEIREEIKALEEKTKELKQILNDHLEKQAEKQKPFLPERPFKPRLKNDFMLFPVDTDSIIPVRPPEEREELIAGAPLDSFSLTARSMAGAQSAAAQGLASLNFSLLEQSQPAGATVAGQFASLGSRTVEDMGFQPAGLARLRQLTDQATATLQAMHPAGAAAAGAGLLALSCLLRGRIGGGKGGASAEASGGGSTGAGATQSPKRPMNVHVEGRRMSSPAELERTLARSGMHPALRTAYVNLMRYDSVLS